MAQASPPIKVSTGGLGEKYKKNKSTMRSTDIYGRVGKSDRRRRQCELLMLNFFDGPLVQYAVTELGLRIVGRSRWR